MSYRTENPGALAAQFGAAAALPPGSFQRPVRIQRESVRRLAPFAFRLFRGENIVMFFNLFVCCAAREAMRLA